MLRYLGEAIAIPPGRHPLPLHTVRGEVQFDNISFAYNGRDDVLKHLSLHIPAGAAIGIVGATGSGKSTLVLLKLILIEALKITAGSRSTAFPTRKFRVRSIAIVSIGDRVLYTGRDRGSLGERSHILEMTG